MNKLKICGVLASVAGFAVSLVASAISDRQMEEAVNKAVDEKIKLVKFQKVVEKEYGIKDANPEFFATLYRPYYDVLINGTYADELERRYDDI